MSREFLRRALIVVAIVVAVFMLWRLIDVALLVFAAVVFSVVLRAASEPISRHTPLPAGAALALVVGALTAVIVGLGWLFGGEIRQQWTEFGSRLPEAWEAARAQLETFAAGERLVSMLRGYEPSGGGLAGRLGSFVTSAADAVLNTVLIIAGGLYLAAQPNLYRNGVLMLVGKSRRPRARQAMAASGEALRLWLLGQLISMTLVGVAVGVGLSIIGTPAPAALGVLAGLAEFVPLVGPVLAAIPALLLATTGGLEMVLWTLGLFIAVQQVESNFITPMVHRQVVRVPPMMTLFSVVAGGVLFGPLGVILAAPLAVVVFVLVKMLYVHDVLGESAELPKAIAEAAERAKA